MDKQILNIFNSVLENNELSIVQELRREDSLRDDLGLDSLALAELTVKIESEFGIDIFEDEIIETVGEALEKIEEK
ncbi:MAG: phosphopantetheine-binding protein [Balneolaceae bacterium]|nr:phosphopantetheine-binding protein [Balneolaceae bacterium]